MRPHRRGPSTRTKTPAFHTTLRARRVRVITGDVRDVAHKPLFLDVAHVPWQFAVVDTVTHSLLKILDRVVLNVPDAREPAKDDPLSQIRELQDEYGLLER